jgi:hypothetical protein
VYPKGYSFRAHHQLGEDGSYSWKAAGILASSNVDPDFDSNREKSKILSLLELQDIVRNRVHIIPPLACYFQIYRLEFLHHLHLRPSARIAETDSFKARLNPRPEAQALPATIARHIPRENIPSIKRYMETPEPS